MEFEIGNIVISTMGRDKGLYFIVVGVEKNYVYLVDGSVRKIDKPKKKKVTNEDFAKVCKNLHDENIAAKVINKHKITNQDIKKALRDILKVN